MKIVMYHYVRHGSDELPYFPYLSSTDFARQIDYFMKSEGVVSRKSFCDWLAGGEAPKGMLLTFDDGIVDHLESVLPILKSRDLFGLFYVPSQPVIEGDFLDMHKVNLSLGRLGGAKILTWLNETYRELTQKLNAYTEDPYTRQQSDEATKNVKKLFNWILTGGQKKAVLNELFSFAFNKNPPRWNEFYLDEDGIRSLSDAGMGVGAHGHTHALLSSLSEKEQHDEIEISTNLIKTLLGNLAWGYCYAHGLPESFDLESQQIVKRTGCPFALAYLDGDIDVRIDDLNRYSLPRYNCNIFNFGQASYGG